MRLSPHEQQILDEIQRGVQAEDPKFFAGMGSQVRRGFGWGSVMFVSGLVAFLVGAVMAQAFPGVGVCVSVAGFLAMFWGVWLLCSGDRALPQHGQENALRRTAGPLEVGRADGVRDRVQPVDDAYRRDLVRGALTAARSTPAGSPIPGHRWRHSSSPDHRSAHPTRPAGPRRATRCAEDDEEKPMGRNGDFEQYWTFHLNNELHKVHETRYTNTTIPTAA